MQEIDFTPEHRQLYALMSDISEDCYCAGWMSGLEDAIWLALETGDRAYGMGEMDKDSLDKVRQLSQSLDGWMVYGHEGLRFLTMSEWRRRLAQ